MTVWNHGDSPPNNTKAICSGYERIDVILRCQVSGSITEQGFLRIKVVIHRHDYLFYRDVCIGVLATQSSTFRKANLRISHCNRYPPDIPGSFLSPTLPYRRWSREKSLGMRIQRQLGRPIKFPEVHSKYRGINAVCGALTLWRTFLVFLITSGLFCMFGSSTVIHHLELQGAAVVAIKIPEIQVRVRTNLPAVIPVRGIRPGRGFFGKTKVLFIWARFTKISPSHYFLCKKKSNAMWTHRNSYKVSCGRARCQSTGLI